MMTVGAAPATIDSDAYVRETAQVIALRLPLAACAFLASLAGVWLIEHWVHPGRDALYSLVYALEVAVWIIGAITARRAAVTHPGWCMPIALACGMLQVFLIASYHIAARGEVEILGLALVYFSAGMMVLIPWGWRGQLTLNLAVLAAFVAAIASGVQAVAPVSLQIIGLACISIATVLSAAALEQYRFGSFRHTAELRHANGELQQANRALAAADDAKNRFLANVSHELRTPLAVMIGYADMVRDGAFGALSTDLHDAIGRIRANSDLLLNLAGDLLDLSRVQTNRIDFNLQDLALAPLCAEATAFTPDLLRDKAVEVVCNVDHDVRVHADRDRLRQVLINLLTNAAKFTRQGRIDVRARRGQNGTAIVEVTDTGIGIPPDELQSIFQPFQRGSHTADIGGTGIGLALSRQLTEAMGGRLSVASTFGRGSTFAVELPVAHTA
jgi:signal transduction histidine kinase